MPLLGTETVLNTGPSRSRRSMTASPTAGLETESDRAKGLLAAQVQAAVRAIDLFTELERRGEKLLAVAPKLRAKGADAVVDQLLNADALVATRGDKKTGMSDRGLRRLFNRLVELGPCASCPVAPRSASTGFSDGRTVHPPKAKRSGVVAGY